jgi:hypothetical protein
MHTIMSRIDPSALEMVRAAEKDREAVRSALRGPVVVSLPDVPADPPPEHVVIIDGHELVTAPPTCPPIRRPSTSSSSTARAGDRAARRRQGANMTAETGPIGQLAARFAATRADGRAALVGYLTGFDPTRGASLDRLLAACEAGLDVLELGVPFSDPTADGPTIQAAMVRALASGASVAGVLELAAELRRRVDVPIVLFGYANPLLRFGPTRSPPPPRPPGSPGCWSSTSRPSTRVSCAARRGPTASTGSACRADHHAPPPRRRARQLQRL